MKKLQLASLTLAALLLAGCGASAASTAESTSEAVSTEETAPAATAAPAETQAPAAALPDGVYTAKFNTDSSMFHANEAVDGMGTLTVENGTMTFHVSLQSQKIVNLYPGMAADAPAHESDWLQPTVDTVTYSDGTSDEVYGFDIPVAAVDADFQLSILGTKGTWYDHTVSVSDAAPAAAAAAAAFSASTKALGLRPRRCGRKAGSTTGTSLASTGAAGSVGDAPSPAAERTEASVSSGVTCSATCSALAAVRRRVRGAGFSVGWSAAGVSGTDGAASSVRAAASRSAARRRARTT